MACPYREGKSRPGVPQCYSILNSLYVQSEFEGGRRVFIRGRIAYDEANERFRILEGEETHDGSIRVFTGRYYFYKEVDMPHYY